MLTARATKRDKVKFFSWEMLYDVFDAGQPVGGLACEPRKLRGTFSFDGKSYVTERASGRGDEMLYQALARVVTGREKEPNPYILKQADGPPLALAEPVKYRFEVTRGEDRFVFRRPFLSRPYRLFRAGCTESLGTVGQAKFFTLTLHMDLPAEFDTPFQFFLLVLVPNVSIKALEHQPSTVN